MYTKHLEITQIQPEHTDSQSLITTSENLKHFTYYSAGIKDDLSSRDIKMLISIFQDSLEAKIRNRSGFTDDNFQFEFKIDCNYQEERLGLQSHQEIMDIIEDSIINKFAFYDRLRIGVDGKKRFYFHARFNLRTEIIELGSPELIYDKLNQFIDSKYDSMFTNHKLNSPSILHRMFNHIIKPTFMVGIPTLLVGSVIKMLFNKVKIN